MASLELVVNRLRKLLYRDGCATTDAELLQRFTTRRDDTAFAALVHRHGSLVMGVCRRVLQDENDCEDAFQATFVILVHKAGSINVSLPSWLHKVAFDLARKAKTRMIRQRQRERQFDPMPEPEKTSQAASKQMSSLLDEELERLPAKYRSALTLCYLAGKTSEEAAQELGCSKDTVRGRLARGRELLRSRLAKKGVELSSGLLTAILAENTIVTAACVNATISAALAVASKGAAAGVLSASVAALVEGGLHQMFLAKVKMVVAVIVAIGLLGTGTGFLTHKLLGGKETGAGDQAMAAPVDKDKPAKADKPKPDDTDPVLLELKKSQGKTDPPGVPLELKLVSKKDTYTLDLGGKTPEEFRKMLAAGKPGSEGKASTFPPVPQVDLEVELRNTGDKEVTILSVNGARDKKTLHLTGPGAVNNLLIFARETEKALKPVPAILAPGKVFTYKFDNLSYGPFGITNASFWTQPGEYVIRTSIETFLSPGPVGAKDGKVTLTSNPVKLKVVAPEKQQGKTDPPGMPLELKLVAKKDTYTLGLKGLGLPGPGMFNLKEKTRDEFLELIKRGSIYTPLPPEVDLEAELLNRSDQEVEVADISSQNMKPTLEGPGVETAAVGVGYQ